MERLRPSHGAHARRVAPALPARTGLRRRRVILAPFGLEGTLTGREWSDSDPPTARMLDAWRQLYPLEQGCGAVEVTICSDPGSVRAGRHADGSRMERLRPSHGAHARRVAPAVPARTGLRRRRVILAPFGLEGTLTGREWSDSDPPTARMLDAWRQLYPLEQGCGAVEVTICSDPGSVRAGRHADGSRMERLRPSHGAHARRVAPALPARTGLRRRRVILAPFGLEGTLTGREWSDSDPPITARMLDAWRQLYPLEQGCGAVEVVCGSARMRYPLPYVLVTEMEAAGAPPATPAAIAHKALQALTTPAPHQTAELSYADAAGDKSEDFVDPTRKTPCTCAKAPIMVKSEPYILGHVAQIGIDRRLTHLTGLSCRLLRSVTDPNESIVLRLEHPVKRFKPTEAYFREELVLGGCEGDLCLIIPEPLLTCHTYKKHPSKISNQTDLFQDDSKEYKNLFTSDGLCATFKDLDQIFDNSDDAASGDETLQVQTPPDSNKSGDEARCRVRAEELSKMFPTPPSMEAHAQPSPGFTLGDETRLHLAQPAPALHLPHRDAGSPAPDQPIEDWSYVFKPPTVCKYVGSSKYAPLATLPSQLLPAVTLPPHAVYRPRARDPQRAHTPAAPHTPAPPGTPGPAPSSVVGNIRGADAATYLNEVCAGWGEGGDEEPPRCTCGFSAVVNRRRAHRAGLFYEDEMEITGLAEEPGLRCGGGGGLTDVAGLVVEQCAGSAGGDASALARAARRAADHAPHDELSLNVLEYTDGGSAAARALREAGGSGAASACSAVSMTGGVHRWPFIGARAPRSSRDVVRLMRRLRPLLQDAIQKRCCGARMWDGVTGPLTWRQFHRLAGRGNEDLCEPQPVPPLLVGHDRDWLALAPYALRHWERLQLEPYSYPRDVAYAVLAPDSEALQDPLRAFFRELSAAYEACRLGRHRPLLRVGRDGILRASPSAANSGDDEWTGPLPSGRASAYIRGSLVPQLAGITVDRTLIDGERPDTVRPPTAPEPGTPHDENEGGITAPYNSPAWHEEDESGTPALVIYVDGVPVGSGGAGAGAAAGARALAFSVFTGARRLLQHRADGKSLTGFGTAAAANLKRTARHTSCSPPRGCCPRPACWAAARARLPTAGGSRAASKAPSRRRRSGPARRLGLTKLMDFTLGVMSQAAQPWRLVVGRVGRIGHGELKVLPQAAVPCILSACLVSTEPEPALRLMADRFTPDERFSQHSLHSALHTPRDTPMANGEDNDMMFLNVDMGDEDMGDDQMTDIFSTDMFNSMFAQTSPTRRGDEDGAGEEAAAHAHANAHKQRGDNDQHEAVGTVLQQPLALGYLVSTAPLGGMPAWWWAGCGHLRDACPAFLRSALHLQQADDITSLLQRRDHNAHPLDSQLTTDVLRYVLEGYNALSWLALDGNTADRVSCLPLHVQVLMQLYHTAAALG
ncbi:putative Thyroid hormone receptor-associated protein [Operophtera brumata]|uniref:Mediator of RNA polymerase II transcription subunit 13 n=1 Tax=Operophtera brumata TaxID=104452 RepID=A0A0L7LUB8_OPEBR|nr:putative Thyroid hormone receptor-associated protein [Operophtera brumata]